jgi:hypothetical protein
MDITLGVKVASLDAITRQARANELAAASEVLGLTNDEEREFVRLFFGSDVELAEKSKTPPCRGVGLAIQCRQPRGVRASPALHQTSRGATVIHRCTTHQKCRRSGLTPSPCTAQ